MADGDTDSSDGTTGSGTSGTGSSTAPGKNKWTLRDMLPSFSLDNIFSWAFWGIILAVIAVVVLRAFPQVRELIPEDWQAGINDWLRDHIGWELFPGASIEKYLAGLDPAATDPKKNAKAVLKSHGVDDGIINVIAADKRTWDDFLSVVKKANGGKLSTDSFMSEATIGALIVERPAMVGAIVAAMPARDPNKPADATMAVMVKSLVNVMLKNPEAVRQLLVTLPPTALQKNPMLQQAHTLAMDANNFNLLVTSLRTIEKTQPGKAVEMFTALANGDTKAVVTTATTDPNVRAQVQNFAQRANPDTLPPAARPAVEVARDPLKLEAVSQVIQQGLDPAALTQMVDANGKIMVPKVMDFLFDPANRERIVKLDANGNAVTNNLPLLCQLAQAQAMAMKKSDPKSDTRLLEFIGYQNRDKQFVNGTAIFNFIDTVTRNNSGPDKRPLTQKVAMGFINYAMSRDPKTLDGITGTELAAFFSDTNNQNAFARLLTSLDTNGLPLQSPERRMLEALRGNWGNGSNGISAVLRDNDGVGGANQLLEALRHPGAGKLPISLDTQNWFAARTLDALVTTGYLDNSIRDNRFAVANVQHASEPIAGSSALAVTGPRFHLRTLH